MFYRLYFTILFLLISVTLFAQHGIGTNSPHPQAALEISSPDKGLLIPRLALQTSSTMAPVSGVKSNSLESLLVFNTNTATMTNNVVNGLKGKGYYYWSWDSATKTGAWIPISSGTNLYMVDGTLTSTRTVNMDDKPLIFTGDITVNGLTLGKGKNSEIENSTALGKKALSNNETGKNNTAVGSEALFNNTTGEQNDALGVKSLYRNTTGSKNVAIGYTSLHDNDVGYNNVATGFEALKRNQGGYQNTAIGALALSNNVTGSRNTAFGEQALNNNSTGNFNTVLGYNTGIGITTGSNNTIIGARVDKLPTDLNKNIIIADGEGNQRIRINHNGMIGMGTTSPTAALDITSSNNGLLIPRISLAASATYGLLAGTATESIMVYNTNTATNTGLSGKGFYYWNSNTSTGTWVKIGSGEGVVDQDKDTKITAVDLDGTATNSDTLEFQVAGTEKMRIDSQGRIGINTKTPSTTLDVQGAGLMHNLLIAGGAVVSSTTPTPSAIIKPWDVGPDPTDTFWELTKKSDGKDRTQGTEFRIFDNGNVGVGVTTTTAAFEIKSNDRGLMIPRFSLTTSSTYGLKGGGAPNKNGMLIYNTNTKTNTLVSGLNGTGFYYWNNPNWVKIDTGEDDVRLIGSSYIGANAGPGGNGAKEGTSSDLNNIFLGKSAGVSNTTGMDNIFLGRFAGISNSNGQRNLFLGAFTGEDNTEGFDNTFMGTWAGRNNTQGSHNTFLGKSAGNTNTTGENNVFLGENAGSHDATQSGLGDNTNSSNSIMIGRDSKSKVATTINEIVIGHEAIGLGSNTVVLGNEDIEFTALKGKVGMGTGTTTPVAALQIDSKDSGILIPRIRLTSSTLYGLTGTATESMLVYNTNIDTNTLDSGLDGQGFYYWYNNSWVKIGSGEGVVDKDKDTKITAVDIDGSGTNSDTLEFQVAGTERMRIDSQGRIGIGTSSPTAALDITSSNNGILIPRIRLTSSTLYGLAGTATESMLVYNTNTDTNTLVSGLNGTGFYYWNSNTSTGTWVKIGSGEGVVDQDKDTKITAVDIDGSGTNSDTLEFQVAGTEKMRIDSQGRIGINTKTPSTTLDVQGAGLMHNLLIAGGAVVSSTTPTPSAIIKPWDVGPDPTDTFWELTKKSDGKDRTQGTEFRIFDNGNVGVGVTTTTAAFEIKSNDRGLMIPRFSLTTSSTYGLKGGGAPNKNGMLIYNTNTKTNTLVSGLNGTGFYYWNNPNWVKIGSGEGVVDIDKDTKINAVDIDGSGTNSDTLEFQVAGTEKMRIDSQGRIGIGTPNPDKTLTVSGSLRVTNATGSHTLFTNPSKNRVGINTDTPSTTLDVQGAGLMHNLLIAGGEVVNSNTPTPSASIEPWDVGPDPTDTFWQLNKKSDGKDRATDTAFVITDSGKVGIGTNSPTAGATLDVRGDVYSTGSKLSSDRRYKTEIQNIKNALEILLKLRGVKHDWIKGTLNGREFKGGTTLGVIAQEIEVHLPELVTTDANGYKSVEYSKITALLIEAIKEQQQQIDNQEKRLKIIEEKLGLK